MLKGALYCNVAVDWLLPTRAMATTSDDMKQFLFTRVSPVCFRRMSSITESVVQYISPAPGEFVAYRQSPGKTPGVVFLPGLMSNMDGTKAMALERYCRSIGHSYVRFDYRGHGLSSGTSQECTIGMRKEDVLTILDNVTKGMLCSVCLFYFNPLYEREKFLFKLYAPLLPALSHS